MTNYRPPVIRVANLGEMRKIKPWATIATPMMIRGNEKYMDNIAKGESGKKLLYKIFFKIINSGS